MTVTLKTEDIKKLVKDIITRDAKMLIEEGLFGNKASVVMTRSGDVGAVYCADVSEKDIRNEIKTSFASTFPEMKVTNISFSRKKGGVIAEVDLEEKSKKEPEKKGEK